MTKKALRTLTTSVHGNGFFQFEGIAPGSYVATISHPEYATTTLDPVVVEKDAETAIREPIILERPLDLTVAVEPPLDAQGRAWTVTVSHTNALDGYTSPTPAPPLSSPGLFRSARLSPGPYRILLRDADRQQMASQEFVLTPDSDTAYLRPEFLELHGSVYLGEQPLARAAVRLSSRAATARLRFQADDHGDFAGQLPKGHRWRAEVVADSPRVDTSVGGVDISEVDTEATLNIRLPDTEVRGTVADSAGQGIPALVEYFNLSAPAQTSLRTDAAGRFQLRGLPHGQYVFSATALAGRAESHAARVTLDDAADSAAVHLTVADATVLAGLVSTSVGPLARTLVLGTPKYADGTFNVLGGAQAETGADGAFELSVPSAARSIDLIMMARGRVLDARTLVLPASTPVGLRLPDTVGMVRLSWRTPLDLRDTRVALPALILRGVVLYMPVLTTWMRQHGIALAADTTEIDIPNLPPGPYRACFPLAGQMLADWLVRPEGRCIDGLLPEGGTLMLSEP